MPRKKKTETITEKAEKSSLKKTSEKESEEVKEETEKVEAVETKSEEKKETEKTETKAEEFPELELGIDIFAPQNKSEDKKEKPEETKEASKTLKPKELTDSQKLERLKLISDKAKKLAERIAEKEKINVEEVREELKEAGKKKRSETSLFPLDDYVKYSVHLGTKAITPTMRQFVYKRRADGLAVLNTNSIDEKLKEGVEFLKGFAPEDIFLACKREAGWPAAKKFSEVTGIKVFTKKYPAGIITNTRLTDFFEVELVIICDPWLDKNALNDAIRIKKPVMGLCDTNNLTKGLVKVIPCNNKSAKSLGLMLYLIAREYLKLRGKEKESKELNIEDFTGKIEEERTTGEAGAKEGV